MTSIQIHTLSSLVACALLWAPAAGAQEILSSEGIEITRDASELQDLISAQGDRDLVDTAVVFTNETNAPTRVSCTGYDKNGKIVGHGWLRVPARGLRFGLASDLSDERDFIGSILCWSTRSAVIGSAFLLKPLAITDLPSRHLRRRRLVAAEAIKELSSAGEVRAPAVRVEANAEPPSPVLLAVGLIRFPVVATY